MRKTRSSKGSKSNIVYVMQAQPQTVPKLGETKRTKRKPKLRAVFLILFSLWALYTFLFGLMPNKARLDREKQQLQQHLTELRQQEQELTNEYNSLQDDSYIMRIARKTYNMIKEGEIIYKP